MAMTQPPRIASIVFESASLSVGFVGVSLAARGSAATVRISAVALLLTLVGVAAAPLSLMLGFLATIVIHRFRLRTSSAP